MENIQIILFISYIILLMLLFAESHILLRDLQSGQTSNTQTSSSGSSTTSTTSTSTTSTSGTSTTTSSGTSSTTSTGTSSTTSTGTSSTTSSGTSSTTSTGTSSTTSTGTSSTTSGSGTTTTTTTSNTGDSSSTTSTGSTPTSGGSSSQQGSTSTSGGTSSPSNGSTSTTGGSSTGGTSQGGTTQGGTTQGGTSQGGTTQGGTSQGGTSQGGASGSGPTNASNTQIMSTSTTTNPNAAPLKTDINSSMLPTVTSQAQMVQPSYLNQVITNVNSLQTNYALTASQNQQMSSNLNNILSTYSQSLNQQGGGMSVSSSIFSVANLAMQTSKSSNNVTSILDTQNSIKDLSQSIVKSSISQSNNSVISVQGSSFAIQIYDNSNYKKLVEDSVQNKISVINTTLCENKIKQKYNITDHLYIQKVDFNTSDGNSSKTMNGSVSYSLYNPKTGEKFNISTECSDTPVNVNFPLPTNTTMNVSNVKKYMSLGYNVMNKSDTFFSNRCIRVVQNGVEVTISKRNNLFGNESAGCSTGCTFQGIDSNNYIICSCQNNSDVGVYTENNVFLTAFSSLNYDIVKCIANVSDEGNFFNVGFFCIGIIVVAFIISYFILMNINKELILSRSEDVIHFNGYFYDPELMSSDEYFSKFENGKGSETINKQTTIQRGSIKNVPVESSSGKILVIGDNKINEGNEEESKNINNESVKRKDLESQEGRGISPLEIQMENKNEFMEVNVNISIAPYADLAKLTIEEQIKYDKRTFKEYFIDNVYHMHSIAVTFMTPLLIPPSIIRLIDFFTRVSFLFSLNALVYTDTYIEKQNNIKTDNGSSIENFEITLIKSVTANAINFVVLTFLGLFLIIPKNYKEDLNNCLKSRNVQTIIVGNYEFVDRMLWRYVCFGISCLCVVVFSWYYVVCFCGIYFSSSWSWCTGGLLSLAIDWFVVQFAKPLFLASFRSMCFRYESMR